MSREQAKAIIEKLVERFAEHRKDYHLSDYNEQKTRQDFINPFFKALGWDIDNEKGDSEAYREVIYEDKVVVKGKAKAPDYGFRLSGSGKKRLFYVEAKKPAVPLKTNKESAYQLRRYGSSAQAYVSILTNFEDFIIYDCSKVPNLNDAATVARLKHIHFEDYVKEFDFIYDIFSHEAVTKGRFDKFIQASATKKGTDTLDKRFVQSLDQWRKYLATSFAVNNKKINDEELNFAVQLTIDRLIFLRFCEDRSVEPYGQLQKAASKGDAYKNLLDLFQQADDKYNSGLFDFRKDKITTSLKIDNKVIKNVIDDLYYPKCNYEFSVMPVEILGNAYEQFLGKVIRITPARGVKIEEKPEVRKAGGVYYTPQYVVDYIVKNTVGKLIDGKTPKEIEKIKIVDPSCGSGSFLLGAFEYLLSYHINWYHNKGFADKKGKDNPFTPQGTLTTHEKKRILLSSIYGVDIDANAVEVTKLSLLLKCMEGETEASIKQQIIMFHERVLPDLDNNIKDGNSLVDTDYYDEQIDLGYERKIKPFSWKKGFPEIFKSGGFNAVIGNPPYGAVYDDHQKDYFISHYKTVEGRYDNFELFIEKGIKLAEKNGVLSFIIPSPFLTNLYSRKLRQHIVSDCNLKEVVSFSMQVFEDPTVHTCIIIVSPTSDPKGKVIVKNNVDSIHKLNSNEHFEMSQDEIKKNANFVIDVFINPIAKSIIDKLHSKSKTLGDVCYIRQCIKTGDDEIYVTSSNSKLKDPWKKSLRGKSIQRYSTVETDLYLKYGDWLARNWKNKSFYETNKIAIRETGKRITATLDLDNRYFLSSIYAIYFKQAELNNENDLKFLLGILNSELANYFIKLIALNLTEGAFTKVRTNQLARLPIIQTQSKGSLSLKNEIIKNVDLLLKLNSELKEVKLQTKTDQIKQRIEHSEEKINQTVYELYELTPPEIKVVEGGANE